MWTMECLDSVRAAPAPTSRLDIPAVSLFPRIVFYLSVVRGSSSPTADIGKNSKNFNLPSGTRQSLSSILIVHPVAAFLTLVCFCLAIAAHFHAPSHSPRFLLALLILLLPTLLVSLLAFLVDILLFVPHLQWGGWIVLVATIILVSCGVVTCAMRRTLVSRKARKRRIAENAEMSGENYYNRQNTAPAALASGSAPPGEAKEPVVSNSSTSEANPSYAHFRSGARDSDDDRTPLNSSLTSSTRLTDVPGSDGQYPSRRGTPYRGPQDEAGLPPSGPYGAGMMYDPSDPRSRQQYPDGGMGPRRGGGPPGFGPRGRGGYPPRGGYGRGGPYMGPRGPPGARGGWGPRGGRGGPMPGRGPSRGGMGYAPGAGLSFDSYGRPVDDPYELPGSGPMGPMREPSPASIGMAMSPEIIGQAIEMQPQSRGYEGSDSMASTLDDSHPHALSVEGQVAPLESPSSQYSRRESVFPVYHVNILLTPSLPDRTYLPELAGVPTTVARTCRLVISPRPRLQLDMVPTTTKTWTLALPVGLHL